MKKNGTKSWKRLRKTTGSFVYRLPARASAQLLVRTTWTAEDSAVARLIRLVEEAQANRSATEKLVE